MPYTYKRSTVPQLFTQWWVFWHKSEASSFPKLPSALASLSEDEMAGYASQGALADNVDTAIQSIWDSDYQPVIETMLSVYHMRQQVQKPNQHPEPSMASAHEFMNSNHDFTEDQKATIEPIIENGKKWRSTGEEVFLFGRNACSPGPSIVGKGVTRRREVDDEAVDDEGIPVKKQRREE